MPKTLSTKKKLDVADLKSLVLAIGSHKDRSDGLCAMEAAAFLAGRAHSDAPECVSPVIRSLLINLNDHCPDGPRQKLKDILPDILGTATRRSELQRAYQIASWAVCFVAPLALDAVGMKAEAEKLRKTSPIEDKKTAAAAYATATAAAATTAAAAATDAATAAAAAYAANAAAYASYAAAAAVAANAANAANAAYAAKEKMWDRIIDSAVVLIRELSLPPAAGL